MIECFEFKQLNDVLELPYITPVDGCIDMGKINPIEHPVLFLYKISEQTFQKMVYGKISYSNLLKCGGYLSVLPRITPDTEIETDMPANYLFKIPWSLTFTSDKKADLSNIKITADYDYDTTMVLQLFGRDQSGIFRWILENVLRFGTPGMLQLMEHNGYKLTVCDATKDDYLYFTRKHPNKAVPGKGEWFSLHPLDIPGNTTLKIYPDGTVHVTYMELFDWILFQCKRGMLDAHTLYYKQDPSVWSSKLAELEVSMFPPATSKRSRQARPVYDIEDIDQLIGQMAPCVSNIIRGGRRYPKNEGRKKLIPILAAGGIPLETTEKLLNKLHSVDSNGKNSDGISRFPPKYYYEKSEKDVINPSGCSKMCTCPFKKDEIPQLRCSKEFEQRFPDVEMGLYITPVNWFHWINKK